MEEKEVSFSVQMTVKELYRFIMYHAYHKFSGIFGILLAVFAAIALATSYEQLTEQTRAVLILVMIWFIVLDPVILYSRARGQVKRNKAYKQPLNYKADANGITISQEEQQQMVEWEKFFKVVETKQQFLVYSTPVYAFIFPKSQMGEEDSRNFHELVLVSTKDTRVQLKGMLKK